MGNPTRECPIQSHAPKWSIPTTYAGVRMRSKLEATYAQFFDQHRMRWAYEPEGFHLPGDVFYLPDFYLGEIRAIVEVKGVLDGSDHEKLRALVVPAASQGIMTVLAEPGLMFRLCNPSPEFYAGIKADDGLPDFLAEWAFDPECDLSRDIALVRCAACGHWYFIDSSLGWQCTACGHYAGNETFDLVHPGSHDWTTYDCPDCGMEGT